MSFYAWKQIKKFTLKLTFNMSTNLRNNLHENFQIYRELYYCYCICVALYMCCSNVYALLKCLCVAQMFMCCSNVFDLLKCDNDFRVKKNTCIYTIV